MPDEYTVENVARDKAHLHLSWRLIALVCFLITIASLTALIIVAVVTDADALASVALILAILAFVIQILVFVVDSFSTARRDREANEIYTDTQVLLARIEEKTASTNNTVNNQMQQVMELFMNNVKSQSESNDPETQASLIDSARRAVELVNEQSTSPANPPTKASRRADHLARRAHDLRRWPPLSIVVQLEKDNFATLSPRERKVIVLLGFDIESSTAQSVPEGLILEDFEAEIESLTASGFVKQSDAGFLNTLTGQGFAAARILLAPEPIPPQVLEVFPDLTVWREAAKQPL